MGNRIGTGGNGNQVPFALKLACVAATLRRSQAGNSEPQDPRTSAKVYTEEVDAVLYAASLMALVSPLFTRSDHSAARQRKRRRGVTFLEGCAGCDGW